MGCQRTQLQECLGIEALDVMIGRLKVLENATQQLVVKEKLIICPVVLVSRRSRKKPEQRPFSYKVLLCVVLAGCLIYSRSKGLVTRATN